MISISLIGARSEAVQSESKQQQFVSSCECYLSATPFSAISILKGVNVFCEDWEMMEV